MMLLSVALLEKACRSVGFNTDVVSQVVTHDDMSLHESYAFQFVHVALTSSGFSMLPWF